MNRREIKFRAWDDENEKMHTMEGVLHGIDLSNQQAILVDAQTKGFYQISAILLQNTGLKDKHGIEIYEGDIVKAHEGANFRVEGGTLTEVIYQGNGFSLKAEDFGFEGEDLWDWREIEVVGNKYENPELLSSGKSQKGKLSLHKLKGKLTPVFLLIDLIDMKRRKQIKPKEYNELIDEARINAIRSRKEILEMFDSED